MVRFKPTKVERMLSLYSRLINNEQIDKKKETEEWEISDKSFERDKEEMNLFLARQGSRRKIIYDRSTKKYMLNRGDETGLTNSEALVVCKILLESRAFEKGELNILLDKLLNLCVPRSNYDKVKELIKNEREHYIEPQHRTKFIEKIWDIGQAVKNQNYIRIEYRRLDGKTVIRRIKPVGIMFSEYYFYLTAFHDNREHLNIKDRDDLNPTIFRIDRIKRYEVLSNEPTFKVPYESRFQEGEFRKRIQFMTNGPLKKIKFRYRNRYTEAMLDRLPTAKILETVKISEDDVYHIVEVEVFGNGIDRWILSQGDSIELMDR